MTDLTPNHPAVEAAACAGRVSDEAEIAASEAYAQGVGEHPFSQRMRAAITAALPHLTADDLRNTPAGRALMAEGWEAACRKVIRMAWADSSDAEYLADEGNPYRKDKEEGRG